MLLLIIIYLNKTTYIETFATCISREYIKKDDDEYEPVQEVMCNGLSNKECKRQEQDCVLIDRDEEDFEEEYNEDTQHQLNKMIGYCMKKDPTVTLNINCMQRKLTSPRRRRRRLNKRYGMRSIVKECSLKSKNKYVIDKDCQLF